MAKPKAKHIQLFISSGVMPREDAAVKVRRMSAYSESGGQPGRERVPSIVSWPVARQLGRESDFCAVKVKDTAQKQETKSKDGEVAVAESSYKYTHDAWQSAHANSLGPFLLRLWTASPKGSSLCFCIC